MFTNAIAQLPTTQANIALDKLWRLHDRGIDTVVQYVQLFFGRDNQSIVMLRNDTPNDIKQWLCGFFANT